MGLMRCSGGTGSLASASPATAWLSDFKRLDLGEGLALGPAGLASALGLGSSSGFQVLESSTRANSCEPSLITARKGFGQVYLAGSFLTIRLNAASRSSCPEMRIRDCSASLLSA